MSISPELLYAILSMDAYNRGYEPGIAGLGGEGSLIGNATVKKDATQLLNPGEAQAAGFYAVAYDWYGDTIISYRGTDKYGEIPSVDLPIARNDDYDEDQIHLASRFYQAVADSASPYSMVLTGHSLGGALAGFVGSLFSQHIVAVAPIGFWPAYLEFKELIDRYLLVKNTPQEFTDEIDVPGVFGKVNTVQFAESQLQAMGIPFNDIPPLDDVLDQYTAFHASGEVAGQVRTAATPSTPILGQLGDMGDLVGLGNAHSVSFTVILKYIDEMGVALDFQQLLLPLFSALFDGQLADLAGAEVTGLSNSNTVMRDAIAYSALEEGLVFGNTGIRALFNDANELGKLGTEGQAPIGYTQTEARLAEAIVQFAGQMALNKVNYTQQMDKDPEEGFLSTYESNGRTVLKADLTNGLWNLGGEANPDVEVKGIRTLLETFFANDPAGNVLLEGMEHLYGNKTISSARVINRMDFALGAGALTVELQAPEVLAETANPKTTSLFVASAQADEVRGTRHNNMLVGQGGDDQLYGNEGKDLLVGGAGDDTLYGGSGEDWLHGGEGEDTAEYSEGDQGLPPPTGITLTFDLRAGLDLQGHKSLVVSDDGYGQTDHLFSIEKILGTADEADTVVVNGGDAVFEASTYGLSTGHLEAEGGSGWDFFFNNSYKGQMYRDSLDGTGGGNTDVFWWSGNSFLIPKTAVALATTAHTSMGSA